MEMICNGFLESLTLFFSQYGSSNAIIWKMELLDKKKADEMQVSDNHRRGFNSSGLSVVGIEVPLLPYFAPDKQTEIVGPLTFMFKAVWYNQYAFIVG